MWETVAGGESGAVVRRRNGIYRKESADPRHDLVGEGERLRWLRDNGIPAAEVLECRPGLLVTAEVPGRSAADDWPAVSRPRIIDALADLTRSLHALPVADGLARPVADGLARPVVDGLARPVDGLARLVADGPARLVADGPARLVAGGPARLGPASAEGSARSGCPFDRRLAVTIPEALAAEVDLDDLDAERAGWSRDHLVAALLATRPEAEDVVVCHGDLCLPNVLFDPDTHEVTGVIDAGRLGLADRWTDLALATRSMTSQQNPQYGTWAAERFLSRYGIAPDPAKNAYYRLLDEFF